MIINQFLDDSPDTPEINNKKLNNNLNEKLEYLLTNKFDHLAVIFYKCCFSTRKISD